MQIQVERTIAGLKAESEEAYKVLGRIAVGAILTIDVKDPRRRSTDQHNFWFAMVNTLYESQEHYKDFNHFRHALLVAMKYRHEYKLKSGEIYYEPKSLAFGKMSQQEFSQLVDDTLDFAEDLGFSRDELLKFTRERAGMVA